MSYFNNDTNTGEGGGGSFGSYYNSNAGSAYDDDYLYCATVHPPTAQTNLDEMKAEQAALRVALTSAAAENTVRKVEQLTEDAIWEFDWQDPEQSQDQSSARTVWQ
ncbi:hypothetical protein B9479_006195 [Cryptococcus floricola]|uniref:Uncharacterized protein n=1 Tax=Cryptococcus floricola TaxID=2591691 RepID=A0A5D3ANS1_9TREE|nr:hypothetical protein B9479_006195 [Cryptococcus floricola]